MPRKTHDVRTGKGRHATGFNEAAARCRGKHTPLRYQYRGAPVLQ